MTAEDDDDLNRTVIRPRPGGRRAQPGAERGTAAGGAVPAAGPMVERFAANNPLVAAAGPLLTLATLIRGTPTQPDIEGLRRRAAEEIRAFETRAGKLDLPRNTVRMARYALAATIDDVAQNTPWGGNDVWAARSMVASFDREAIGGERFYEVLDQAHKEPGSNLWLLELMYLCLSLGFQGRLRVERRGADELARLRSGLYATIRNQRGEFERDLSPRWRGMEIGHRMLRRRFPVWLVWVLTAGLMVFAWLGLDYLLNLEADTPVAALAGVPGIDATKGRETAPVSEPAAAAAPQAPAEPAPLDRVQGFLEPEIREGLVEVFGKGQAVIIRIRAPGMFASGSDVPSDRARAILARVAAALAEEPGKVKVIGHSDNVPIRTARFPSNWALSEARAQSAAGLIRARLDDPARVTVEGRGASEPIADNGTPEGRARNRRIEVELRPDRVVTVRIGAEETAQ